jgi:hypothetical protein
VVYLTVSMTFAVRALSSLLIVWLTAAASIPLCCWSISSAHSHQEQQEASTVHQHAHHHHGGADSAVSTTAAPVMSAMPAHDCDTESVEAVVTTRPSLSFADMRAADAIFAEVVVPHVSATGSERSDSAPPGGLPGSAFLNPLRV